MVRCRFDPVDQAGEPHALGGAGLHRQTPLSDLRAGDLAARHTNFSLWHAIDLHRRPVANAVVRVRGEPRDSPCAVGEGRQVPEREGLESAVLDLALPTESRGLPTKAGARSDGAVPPSGG